jgi:pyruvate/2-oxoglutarate dehydrogenase complex dihydrolipoamide acyltransferase (E2) component
MWMKIRRFSDVLVACFGLLGLASSAAAQSKPPAAAKPAKAAKPPAKAKPAKAPVTKAKKPAKTPEAEVSADEAAPAEEGPKPTGEGESQLKAAGTTSAGTPSGKEAVSQQEDPEGVKTYHFGAIEVESRLKSPQLIYFLRRVRAEFEAGALGHRSFLGELADTRHDPAFR